jgi:CBS domain-containing protein
MQVSEAMTRGVSLASPGQTIREAARAMADKDTGALPVGENDRLVGMVTDRDIAVRAVAEGKGPDTKVSEVMTPGVEYCFEDQDLDEVARTMGGKQVRRLPVLNRDKRLVGILSLGDVAVMQGGGTAQQAIGGVSQPGGEHSQTGGPRS